MYYHHSRTHLALDKDAPDVFILPDKVADARTKQTISGATPEWIPDSGRATHELA